MWSRRSRTASAPCCSNRSRRAGSALGQAGQPDQAVDGLAELVGDVGQERRQPFLAVVAADLAVDLGEALAQGARPAADFRRPGRPWRPRWPLRGAAADGAQGEGVQRPQALVPGQGLRQVGREVARAEGLQVDPGQALVALFQLRQEDRLPVGLTQGVEGLRGALEGPPALLPLLGGAGYGGLRGVAVAVPEEGPPVALPAQEEGGVTPGAAPRLALLLLPGERRLGAGTPLQAPVEGLQARLRPLEGEHRLGGAGLRGRPGERARPGGARPGERGDGAGLEEEQAPPPPGSSPAAGDPGRGGNR